MPQRRRIDKKPIFRRGFLFTETGLDNKSLYGLYLSHSKGIWKAALNLFREFGINEKKFPTPNSTQFTEIELRRRHSGGVFLLKSARQYDPIFRNGSC